MRPGSRPAHLREHAGRAAVEQPAARHEDQVRLLAELTVAEQRRPERGHHALRPIERRQSYLERRPGAGGMAQQLVRAERVEVIEAVEQKDVDLHGVDARAACAATPVAEMTMTV